jgi:hypothetical protein
MKKAEYSHVDELKEEPIEIIITSAYYKSHEWWAETKKFLRQMADGDPDVKGIFLELRRFLAIPQYTQSSLE